MSKGKGKKQFQGAGRRFRADIWMDEKVSGRTMYALQELSLIHILKICYVSADFYKYQCASDVIYSFCGRMNAF